MLNCGIVGLPNVGKSTLFNAITSTQKAQSANYPFCTIEPNKGIVDVPDKRLNVIANLSKSKAILPAKLEFVDIAGLVKGAHKGEGLGNQFLATIKEVDAIIHVLRCFDDNNIIHVEESVDPVRDAEIIDLELIMADLESLEKRLSGLEKKAKIGNKEAKEQLNVIEKILPHLRNGKVVRKLQFTYEEKLVVKSLFLLTSKPVLYICNVKEDDIAQENNYVAKVKEMAQKEDSNYIMISAQLEQEISSLASLEEKQEYLNALGLQDTGLDKIIRSAFDLLNLQTFFTAGPQETRAWTIKKGTKAPQGAGEIHSDFEKGFICAETIAYEDFVKLGGEQKAKEMGKSRQEGKNYTILDGDIILFRFNV
ncbi:Redox-regulated ATPase YchF [Candidatus Hepatincolaceae symbiont of Richtersius coronifer]